MGCGLLYACDPRTWPREEDILSVPGWKIAVGIHPTISPQHDDYRNEKVTKLVRSGKVQALQGSCKGPKEGVEGPDG